MGRFLILLALLTLFLFSLNTELKAQNNIQQAKLNQLSKTYSNEFQREKESALKLADSLGIPVRHEFENGRVVELRRFVNGRPVYITTFNAAGADLINTDEVYSGGTAGLSLSGNGQILGIWDAGIVLTTHEQLTGRVSVGDGSATVNNHATRVGGTMIASGQNDAAAKGMAFDANLESYNWDFDHSEMADAAAAGLLLSVHPYGYEAGWDLVGTDWYWRGDATLTEDFSFGFYDQTYAEVWDEIAFNAPNYLIVTPAGNQRGVIAPQTVRDNENFYVYETDSYVLCSQYDSGNGCNNNYEDDGGSDGFDSIAYNALAKNVMTVGSVDTNENLSTDTGFGPTDDGRVKPDIVAKGVNVYSTHGSGNSAYSTSSGTSFSAPMIGGSVGLLLEHQENLHPGEKLLSSTLKALVLHTAKDLGNTGPDYTFGWGLMDTQKAAEVMSLNDSNDIHIKELTLHEGETISFPVQASGSEDLRITMAWTDPAGTPATFGTLNPTDLMLVNDLDMELEDESSNVSQPYILDPSNPGNNATTGDNFRDNIEMVHVTSPPAGEIYTVTITHKSSLTNGSQNVSLIITGNEGVDYQQQITEGNGEGWRFLSSPVASASYKELLNPLWTQGTSNSDYPAASNSNVLVYDGSEYSSVSDLNTSIDAGSGVAVFVYEDDDFDGSPDAWAKTLTVNGMENLNDVNVSDLINPGNNVFTILGNPFNSTIDFDEFTSQNEIGGTVYVYDHAFDPGTFSDPDEDGGEAGGGFRAWNGVAGSLSDGLIAPFQGFFIYATGNSPALTIPTTAKSNTSATFYKEKEQVPVPVIEIAAQLDGKYSADTWFSFTESGSIKKNKMDAPYLYPLDFEPFLSIRSETDGLGYLIKNLPLSLNEPLEIPISIEAWQPNGNTYTPLGGSVELVWPKLHNLPQDWTVTLTDHHNRSVIDLKNNNRYRFTLSESKAKVDSSLPYSMNLKAADEIMGNEARFTLTIYPEPLAINQSGETPSEFTLKQNYPNPFNPSTVIRYSLPENSNVELDIYTIDGQKVATLVDESQSAGNHTVTFNGSDLSSGVYIYRLTTAERIISRKMVLIK